MHICNANRMTMKKSILLIAFAFITILSFAQEMVVKKGPKGLFIPHTVAAKENFYSVGRLYNVPAKEIAVYNGLDMSHGLQIGKSINIPLTPVNFSQSDANGKPVYYVVGQKEGLFRVSANNNNVLLASLRKWNNLTTDNLTPGTKIIVGFLVNGGSETIIAAVPEKKETNAPVKQEAKPEQVQKKEETKQETAKETMARLEEPATEFVPKKQEPKAEEKPVTAKQPTKAAPQTVSNDGSTGFFKSQYQLQLKVQPESRDETVAAGVFKTASGWQDGKYYALMDDVEPGTIIKVVNPNNNKAIYAKVLDKVSGIRQNDGFDLRMSNAAAVALDISDSDKFFVKVVY